MNKDAETPVAHVRAPGPIFLALPLGEATRVKLAGLRESMGEELPGVRWVPPANYHITMRYFGQVNPRRLVKIKALAGEVASGAAATGARLDRVGWFGRRPRVLWAGASTTPEKLAALVAALDLALPKQGPHPFSLHVTLGRFPASAERTVRQGWLAPLEKLAASPGLPLAEGAEARCRFGSLVLHESVPMKGGVWYETLARWPLGG